MRHYGDYAPATVLYFMFTTYRPSTGAAYELAGTPVVRVYKNGSTTQHTTTYSVTANFDTITGLNYFTIDTSADGTFYAAGGQFSCVLEAGTVDSVSVVGTVVATFSLNATAALRPATAGRTLNVGASGHALADLDTIKTQTVATTGAGTVTIPAAATLASTTNITAGTITTATNVTTVNGLAANVITAASMNADASAEIADAVWEEAQADHVAAGSFGVIASEIADILVDTAEIGAAGAGLTNINLPDQTMNITGNITGNLSGSVNSVTTGVSIANGAITTTTFGAGAIDAAAIAANAIGASELATDAAEEIADTILGRNVAGGSSAGRTVSQALYALRNKVAVAAGTMTVYQTDDTTSSWTAAVSTTAGDPISTIDPA